MGPQIKKGLILFSVCLNLAFVGMAGYAAFQSVPHDHGGRGMLTQKTGVVEKLGLASALEVEMTELLTVHHLEMRTLRNEMRDKVLVLMALMARPPKPPV